MQKFKIGDICKIVRADNTFRYPKIKDEEEIGFGCYVMIIGSYGQIFPDICSSNTSCYSVYLPKHLNAHIYDKSLFPNQNYADFDCYIPGFGYCNGEFAWAWVSEHCMDFICHPSELDIDALKKYELKRNFNESGMSRWSTWEEMYEHYIKN